MRKMRTRNSFEIVDAETAERSAWPIEYRSAIHADRPETPTTTKDGNDDRGDKKARKKEEELDEDFQISNLVSNYSPEKRKEWAIRHLVTKG